MLVESVPNYSEGRRLEVVDRLANAVTATPGAFLLDRTSDASHNRSVLTLAGESDDVALALEATIATAIETIDMGVQTGEHPRIGAVDVVPFVPLGSTPMDACVALARSFGQRVAERFEIPHACRSLADALGAIGPAAGASLPELRELARIPRVKWAAEAAIRRITK